MGMKLGLVTETFSPAEDWTWLGGAAGTLEAEPITLDGSTFLATWSDGVIPSGILIAKNTSTDKYEPYDPGSNEVQSIIATGGVSGDFTLGFAGETTAAIAYNATAADVQAALEALANVSEGDVVCAGGPLPETAVTVTFQGRYASENVPALVVTDNITGGSATVTTPTAGDAGEGTNGVNVAAGHLFTTTDVGASGIDASAALFWGPGSVIVANLPANHGLDAAARQAMKLIRYR